MNQTYEEHKAYEWEGYYVRDIMATPQGWVGGNYAYL
jgi:hypothetical protein